MQTNNLKDLKKLLNNSIIYKNNNKNYQKYNKPLYQKRQFTEYQNFLYKRALFGISIYKKEYLETMHYDKIRRIKKVHKRSQKILNLYKQKKVNTICLVFFKIFNNSELAKDIFTEKKIDVDEDFKNTLSFKDLKITKSEIVELFIKNGVLPPNFLTLNNNEIKIKEMCRM